MLFDQIQVDMKQALLNKESLRLSVLRMLISELNYKRIDVQREITDEDVVGVIRREVKKREEAIEAYGKAGRQEQVVQETQEKEILQTYLPQMMSEDEIRRKIQDARFIDGVSDFGQAMRVVSPVFKGTAEGSMVAKIVRELLS